MITLKVFFKVVLDSSSYNINVLESGFESINVNSAMLFLFVSNAREAISTVSQMRDYFESRQRENESLITEVRENCNDEEKILFEQCLSGYMESFQSGVEHI